MTIPIKDFNWMIALGMADSMLQESKAALNIAPATRRS